jgi:DNA-binding MarR family transcriptional regulator
MLLVELTDEGRAVLDRASERVAEVDRRLTSCLNPKERDTLLALLGRCMGSLPADRSHAG